MGFEQLAALKKQLAEQAVAKAPRGEKPPRAAALARPAKPVDPVVHAIAKLQRRFPQTFPKNPAPKVPLKIGFFEDLVQHAQALALTEAELHEAIRTWCHGSRYWTCLVEGASRVDLAGLKTGHVSQADAKRALHLQARRSAGARSKPANSSTAG